MKLNLTALSLVFSSFVFAQTSVSGFVYEDANNNSTKDRKEKGLENISVSNGQEVVLTDKNGRYSLPVYGDNMIFIIKPADYQTKMNSNNLPEFYYNYKPSGSPSDFKYKGISPTGELPKEVNFPLYRKNEDKNFQILVFGDPQPYTLKEIDYFKRGIVDEVKKNKKKAVFGISLGDLVGDDLSLQVPYAAAVKEIGLPWYNVMGNHDMNYEAKDDRYSDETFESNFGPNNYAFNYGNVHFLILDDILYPDPRDGKGYWGGFREDQLKFIENDLKLVPKDKLIVLSFHIQMMAENPEDDHFRLEDRKKLFSILKPFENVLMMSAHTHKQSQLFYTKGEGWEGAKNLHEYNAGTTSGDWYSGTADATGVPASVMRDGTFRGYSFLDFKDNKYSINYKVAGKPEDFQINLYVPKVIASKRNSARILANFFMGGKNDQVEYRVDAGEWKPMEYVESIDPNFAQSVFKWDTAAELLQGRRPSNPENSKHLWMAPFPGKLQLGAHKVEVRATDMYGKISNAEQTFQVEEAKQIP
ncbi:calcineurin-like phosphoesterase C-terminal domain-containing protein [Chryseobacterium sp.]|uniref:calcineurin-like phosphoesterase C-terminal domain-containing protein n=1 Tax=Chryseobacterium sp. TaxID=1871047 RepID=UPI0011C98C1C|nr:calcineurin-like phosphoesterase C-terminal domain-containing protein [Chryseobacterium sp.]TXF75027.1 metallophosphoesterase [Chryseobacterium sp.]